MARMCMECLEEYKTEEVMTNLKSSDVGLYQDCPRRACGGRIYTIDDGIVPTIAVLNGKGYTTYSSCSGHQLEVNTECYIEFDEHATRLPSLPEGFQARIRTIEGKRRITIFSRIDVLDPLEELSELFSCWYALYDWAISLEWTSLEEVLFGFGLSKEESVKQKEKPAINKTKLTQPSIQLKGDTDGTTKKKARPPEEK